MSSTSTTNTPPSSSGTDTKTMLPKPGTEICRETLHVLDANLIRIQERMLKIRCGFSEALADEAAALLTLSGNSVDFSHDGEAEDTIVVRPQDWKPRDAAAPGGEIYDEGGFVRGALSSTSSASAGTTRSTSSSSNSTTAQRTSDGHRNTTSTRAGGTRSGSSTTSTTSTTTTSLSGIPPASRTRTMFLLVEQQKLPQYNSAAENATALLSGTTSRVASLMSRLLFSSSSTSAAPATTGARTGDGAAEGGEGAQDSTNSSAKQDKDSQKDHNNAKPKASYNFASAASSSQLHNTEIIQFEPACAARVTLHGFFDHHDQQLGAAAGHKSSADVGQVSSVSSSSFAAFPEAAATIEEEWEIVSKDDALEQSSSSSSASTSAVNIQKAENYFNASSLEEIFRDYEYDFPKPDHVVGQTTMTTGGTKSGKNGTINMNKSRTSNVKQQKTIILEDIFVLKHLKQVGLEFRLVNFLQDLAEAENADLWMLCRSQTEKGYWKWKLNCADQQSNYHNSATSSFRGKNGAQHMTKSLTLQQRHLSSSTTQVTASGSSAAGTPAAPSKSSFSLSINLLGSSSNNGPSATAGRDGASSTHAMKNATFPSMLNSIIAENSNHSVHRGGVLGNHQSSGLTQTTVTDLVESEILQSRPFALCIRRHVEEDELQFGAFCSATSTSFAGTGSCAVATNGTASSTPGGSLHSSGRSAATTTSSSSNSTSSITSWMKQTSASSTGGKANSNSLGSAPPLVPTTTITATASSGIAANSSIRKVVTFPNKKENYTSNAGHLAQVSNTASRTAAPGLHQPTQNSMHINQVAMLSSNLVSGAPAAPGTKKNNVEFEMKPLFGKATTPTGAPSASGSCSSSSDSSSWPLDLMSSSMFFAPRLRAGCGVAAGANTPTTAPAGLQHQEVGGGSSRVGNTTTNGSTVSTKKEDKTLAQLFSEAGDVGTENFLNFGSSSSVKKQDSTAADVNTRQLQERINPRNNLVNLILRSSDNTPLLTSATTSTTGVTKNSGRGGATDRILFPAPANKIGTAGQAAAGPSSQVHLGAAATVPATQQQHTPPLFPTTAVLGVDLVPVLTAAAASAATTARRDCNASQSGADQQDKKKTAAVSSTGGKNKTKTDSETEVEELMTAVAASLSTAEQEDEELAEAIRLSLQIKDSIV
ncbi:unnamed protein product [Amoebophrya sp. A120]|nr:unnamed protein product [Amoebophrya sp. A120]|eukprot:GSA120T00009690001.1